MNISSRQISIIIPIYNEVENIFLLLEEIKKYLDKKIQYEILIVNDNSQDNFLAECNKLELSKNINIINNISNLGQSKSIQKGIMNSKYDNIVTMDGDGQNHPKDILSLADEYFQNNYVLVSGIRKKRKDSFIKKISSKIANNFRSLILKDNCPDTGCGLKIFNKIIFLKIPFFNGIHRFIPALFLSLNQKILYKSVDHRHRIRGISKYGTLDRMFKGLIDIVRVLLIIRKIKRND